MDGTYQHLGKGFGHIHRGFARVAPGDRQNQRQQPEAQNPLKGPKVKEGL